MDHMRISVNEPSSVILRQTKNKTIYRPLKHILRKNTFLTKYPWGPTGSGLDPNCTCTTRPWDQQYKTIIWSLLYLVTEEMRYQHIVHIRTDRRSDGGTTAGWISHTLDWSLTSRVKNRKCIFSELSHFLCCLCAKGKISLYFLFPIGDTRVKKNMICVFQRVLLKGTKIGCT